VDFSVYLTPDAHASEVPGTSALKSAWPCEHPRPSFTHQLQSASWVVLMCYCDAQQFAGIMD